VKRLGATFLFLLSILQYFWLSFGYFASGFGKMNKAFTLVEIIICVVLLAVVGSGLIQLSSGTVKTHDFSSSKLYEGTSSSIAFLHYKPNLKNSTKDLYSLISKQYSIKNDELLRYLKNTKLSIKENELASFKLYDESYSIQKLFTDYSSVIKLKK
jgi:prepilin-type N-terminal cleavage/methylation domain-containing protein